MATLANTKEPVISALTVDLEDYFHVTAFEGHVHRDAWESQPLRLEPGTERILAILDKFEIKSTFFILGWVADRLPDLVKRIHDLGHEIASHGHQHRLVYNQTPDEFREDVKRSKGLLQDISGEEVTGYRAPTFSITPNSAWAHKILAEEGFQYSSSVFPIRHDRYGWPGFGNRPVNIDCGDGKTIWEIPLPYTKLGPILLPFGGGGYLRIYPMWITHQLIRSWMKNPQSLFICYFHPWEIDPGQPRIPIKWMGRIRHYWGLNRMENKIKKMISSYRFGTLSACLARRKNGSGEAAAR